MAKKYYVVWKGEKTGVFDNWSEVQQYTSGRSDAQFMGFSDKASAEAAFKESYTKALMKRSIGQKAPSNAPKATSKSAPAIENFDINIYTDGACSPNPGKSGTGIAVYQQATLKTLWYGLYDANGTNNTAELLGLLYGLKMAKHFVSHTKSIQVLSDSKYSIDSITKWASGWQKKGWKKAGGEPIKNPEIIKECFALYQTLKNDVTITHVKGHADIEGNELADRMAVLARSRQQVELVKYAGELDVKQILAMPSG